MNLGDPEWELIDPTPNVHMLFLQFDKVFFWTKLASRTVVRWSKRMYSCAGICSYEGRAGFCDIALSEPLLKLRPRKDLIETLLHEMIHAYLFVTCRVQERNGHGPNFQAHMYRINKSAGLNITIYHEFHDEVKIYQTHWWRCNGPCQGRKPYFGVVRRTQNRAPGPAECWWSTHQKTCGGTFMKIKEPEKKSKETAAVKTKKNVGDITKYVNNNNNKENANGGFKKPPLAKHFPTTPANKIKTNVGTQKTARPNKGKVPVVPVFSGKGVPVSTSNDVTEAVRNVWANKFPGLISNSQSNTPKKETLLSYNKTDSTINLKKHKADTVHLDSPPAKVKKIDDYFKTKATNILKDVYGEELFEAKTIDDLIASNTTELVSCPICNMKIDSTKINRHLDECLNKQLITELSKDSPQENHSKPVVTNKAVDKKLIKEVTDLPLIPKFNDKHINNQVCKKEFDKVNTVNIDTMKEYLTKTDDHSMDIFSKTQLNEIYKTAAYLKSCENNVLGKDLKQDIEKDTFESNDMNTVKAIDKRINYDKQVRKSDNFIVPNKEAEVDCGFLPSFLDDMASAIKKPIVKIEPGTSKDIVSVLTETKCPCCNNKIVKSMAEHLDECLAFFTNNTNIPEEGASTSFANDTIIIDDDDDIFDETLTMNATGTKTPCPCCMEMIESAEMNDHLDSCLS